MIWRSSHTVEMNWLRVASQSMVTFVAKCCSKVVTAFCVERIDECEGNQHGSFERSAIYFDTFGSIDRIADDRQFQVLFTTDITLDHIAMVDAHGYANGRVTSSITSLVPSVDRLLDIQRAARRIGRVGRTGHGCPKYGHQAVAQKLVDRA